jgi:hypothetical protein
MKSIEEWPADDLVWALLIYPGLNELGFGFQEDTYFSDSFVKLRFVWDDLASPFLKVRKGNK